MLLALNNWARILNVSLQRAVNWASAYDPLDAPLQTETNDTPTVSAGMCLLYGQYHEIMIHPLCQQVCVYYMGSIMR